MLEQGQTINIIYREIAYLVHNHAHTWAKCIQYKIITKLKKIECITAPQYNQSKTNKYVGYHCHTMYAVMWFFCENVEIKSLLIEKNNVQVSQVQK